ncbi:tape measure protein, partial [Benzoatithermus flavus]
MKKLGDAVAAIGGNDQTLESVARAIGQIQAKGKLSAEEMQQLAEAGLPVWDILSKKMGKSTAELMEMTSEGKLLAKDVVPLLVDGLGERFSGAMDKQSKTFSGMMSTLKDNLNMLAGTIAKPAFEFSKSILEKAIPAVNQLQTAFEQGGWTGMLKTIFSADFVTQFTQMNGTVKNFLNQIKSDFQSTFQSLIPKIQPFFDSLKNFFNTVLQAWQSIGPTILSFINFLFRQILTI